MQKNVKITITTYCLQTPDSCRDIDRGKYKDFTFDHSYWSFDSNDENYASQEEVRINIFYQDTKKIRRKTMLFETSRLMI